MLVSNQALLAIGAAAVVGLKAASSWLRKDAASKPRIYCGDGYLQNEILPECPLLLQPYHPTPWALNTHVQSIVGLMRRASIQGNYRRQTILTPDGGTLALDWFDQCDDRSYAPVDAPILLVLHGINGGSHEGYCKWACASACSKGWRAVVLNFRGCNGLPLTSPRGYSATLSSDVHLAIDSIKGRFPSAPVFAAGYSLGSVILAKYLAEADSGQLGSEDGSGLVAACMVSNPVCLEGSAAKMAQPWRLTFLYNLALAYKIKEYVREHRASIEEHNSLDVEAVLASWTLQAVEEKTVLKAFGYKSRGDYYREASTSTHLPQIRTPTLLLLSQDDPFVGVVPIQQCSQNPSTLLAVTARGGHVAFLQGLWPFQQSWMDEVVIQFLEQVLEYQQKQPQQQQQQQQQRRRQPNEQEQVLEYQPNQPSQAKEQDQRWRERTRQDGQEGDENRGTDGTSWSKRDNGQHVLLMSRL